MEWVSGNIFIRPLGGREGFTPGQVCAGHTHNFDHTTIFFTGRWRVRRWARIVDADGVPVLDAAGKEQWHETDNFDRDAPFHVLIKAAQRHEFRFLGPDHGKAWCIYSHRSPQGDVREDYTGWETAYR